MTNNEVKWWQTICSPSHHIVDSAEPLSTSPDIYNKSWLHKAGTTLCDHTHFSHTGEEYKSNTGGDEMPDLEMRPSIEFMKGAYRELGVILQDQGAVSPGDEWRGNNPYIKVPCH